MKDGSLARVTGCSAWGGHDTWYRLCAEKGNMQPDRDDSLKVRIQYDSWNTPEGEETLYYADAKWFEEDAKNKEIIKAGHGGGDWWVAEEFARYVLEDKEPFFNVYRSVSMSAAAILALRSSLNNGVEYKIPDFTKEEERIKWENDTESPFPDENGKATMPCCSHPDFHRSEEDYANAEKDWREMGLI